MVGIGHLNTRSRRRQGDAGIAAMGIGYDTSIHVECWPLLSFVACYLFFDSLFNIFRSIRKRDAEYPVFSLPLHARTVLIQRASGDLIMNKLWRLFHHYSVGAFRIFFCLSIWRNSSRSQYGGVKSRISIRYIIIESLDIYENNILI